MSSFAEKQLRDVTQDLKAGIADFTSKLNYAKLDIAPSIANNATILVFEARVTAMNGKIKGFEETGAERQDRKWRLHPEVFTREVLDDLKHSRAAKTELEQLLRDLESFKVRAARDENLNRKGKSSLEMLNIVSAPESRGSAGTNKRKKKSKVGKLSMLESIIEYYYRESRRRKP